MRPNRAAWGFQAAGARRRLGACGQERPRDGAPPLEPSRTNMLDEIPLSRPDITDREIRLVNDVLRSGRLANGPAIERLEEMVAERAGRRIGVAVSSGTAGLHLSLLALGIGPGDEVITTPFSFVASTNCILYAGATPVFVDIDSRTLNMDPAAVERAVTPRTKAILAVEAFGNPAHMSDYRRIAAKHEIPLIEDCCEGLGGSMRGERIGGFGRVGVFGFYPNKQITTGEGGVIVTDDEKLASACRSMRNQGRPDTAAAQGQGTNIGAWLAHDRLGYNYRLSDVAAAIGIAQMERLDEILAKRQAVAENYMRELMANPFITLPTIETGTMMSWFVFVVRLTEEFEAEERDRIIDGMRRHEIGCAAYFPCIHLLPHVREKLGTKEGDFPVAERVSQRTLALPFFNNLMSTDIDLVSQTLELMISRENLKRT